MEYSYDYRRAGDLDRDQAATRPETSRIPRAAALIRLQALAGAIFFGTLLLLSWNHKGLFMTEIAAVTVICGLVSLIRYQNAASSNNTEQNHL
jgi:hypothetical protein